MGTIGKLELRTYQKGDAEQMAAVFNAVRRGLIRYRCDARRRKAGDTDDRELEAGASCYGPELKVASISRNRCERMGIHIGVNRD